ncbi:hypothetical protein Agabi119p4_7904 [Agaricus bisporus var. burnettii]|uniref:Kinesin motor domain-containing protein n=1 Tax=Agaricus bisporus var. burnettii TaxID=192524 RepID=A0A8H7C911_AGABI|nr:hypothetical protein Agabi119p4_7904 [Agaricus bisporus var. burnettii]
MEGSRSCLIDLAGFEKATFDKERTREGKYINTSLLTLGAVIGTLSDSASKRKKTSNVMLRRKRSKNSGRPVERGAEAPVRARRLSSQEQIAKTKAMRDPNKPVDKANGEESRPASLTNTDFDLSPYRLQQELLAGRTQLKSQANKILSIEASLLSRVLFHAGAPENDNDRVIAGQSRAIKGLDIVVKGYEENIGEPLRAVKEDVEKEWKDKFDEEFRRGRRTRDGRRSWSSNSIARRKYGRNSKD